MSDSNDATGFKRRSVLKNVGVGSVGLLGVAGAASGSEGDAGVDRRRAAYEMRLLDAKYATDEDRRRGLEATGKDVMARLQEADVDVSIEAFDDVRTFAHRDDDTPTAHIVATGETDDHSIEFHALPEAGRAFAFVNDGSVSRRFDSDGVSTMKDCSYNTFCSDDACACQAPSPNCSNCHYYVKTEHCCLYADGTYECEIVDSDCPMDGSCCDDCFC